MTGASLAALCHSRPLSRLYVFRRSRCRLSSSPVAREQFMFLNYYINIACEMSRYYQGAMWFDESLNVVCHTQPITSHASAYCHDAPPRPQLATGTCRDVTVTSPAITLQPLIANSVDAAKLPKTPVPVIHSLRSARSYNTMQPPHSKQQTVTVNSSRARKFAQFVSLKFDRLHEKQLKSSSSCELYIASCISIPSWHNVRDRV